MTFTAEIFTSSIVVVGNFNPAIFSPDWLERNKLIGDGDAIAAREGSQGRELMVSRQVASFESDWFTLQVLENQFSLTSKGVLSPALKDLAVGIFQLVSHTPVKAVGMNFVAHYKLSSFEEYHSIGDILAPKTIWDDLYPDTTAGLGQLTIRIQPGTREHLNSKDQKIITLQPSISIKHGVVLSLNDHHEIISENSELSPAEQVAAIVDNEWEIMWKDAIRVFDQILSKALGK